MKSFKEARKASGLTQAQVAKAVGVSRSTVAMWETEKSEPDNETLRRLAQILNISVGELFGEPASTAARIPVLGSVPAGIPMDAIEDIVDWEDVPPHWTSGGREYFALRVVGDSMWPEYLPGDTVILRRQSDCDSGDDCVVYINGYNATLKRVRLEADGSIQIVPINPQYPPRTYSAEEVQELPISIAGVVVELRRTKKR